MIIDLVDQVNPETESCIRTLLDLAYEGDFSSEDWEHTFGGKYFIGYLGDTIIAHGSVVPRSEAIPRNARICHPLNRSCFDLGFTYVSGL